MPIIGKLEEKISWRQYNVVVTCADLGAAWVWIPSLPWTHFVTLSTSLTLLCLTFSTCKMGAGIIQMLEGSYED